MTNRRMLLALVVLSAAIHGQDASLPLESVSVQGTSISQATVLEIAGLQLGAPVNKGAIERACAKLQESGIFQAINYRYAPGPRRGYVLTLTLADPGLAEAAIDIPGIDESEIWQWLVFRYPDFNHKVPGDEAAQKFLAHRIEDHLGAKLEGQHIVARLETVFSPRQKLLISFQPETLPRVTSMSFAGNREVPSVELSKIMEKVAANQDYIDRRFREMVELNLHPAYEEHGMYRVQFPNIVARKAGPLSIAVTTSIEEGLRFTLGEVRLVGDSLPADAMLAAAKFQKAQLANWTEIQKSIWEMEKPLKRTGYFDAAAKPERILHDDRGVLDLTISFRKGPLYHFGQLRITGLTPDLESRAKQAWKPKPGDPYDYQYPSDFVQAFFQSVTPRPFKKYNIGTQPAAGDHVMDITLAFDPK